MSVDQSALYEARLELVNFLIDAFADYPPEELLERLLEGEFTVPDREVSEELDRGFAKLEEFATENEGRDPADVREDLEPEYTRVFVGPRPPVLPHETYFRTDTDFRGEGLAKVEASYGASGWTPPEEYPEENDHVAVELAFLRYLIKRQRDGDEEAFGFQRVFHDEHLSQWIDDCAEETLSTTDETFYEAAAHLLRGYVAFEEEIANAMT
ncbi:TorD/DmsD family molecular chaperone [Haloparvum sedimenti]|uniref:TorD/DmsD family molecular chaperone n=1 Tax=Haloparvum sedimenti TaxID=1678448 RepID=UPI00071E73A5|nr:molecular chaperone TorD family protein [Haloparvum sedimenti]